MSGCELRGQFEGREVAERLRTNFVSFARGGEESAVTYPLRCICALARLIGAESTDWLSINARLADLIDPTTTVDETEVETVADAVHLCECNECGHSFEWVYGEYEYCPRCGSRIVGGNEYEKASNPVPLEGGGAE